MGTTTQILPSLNLTKDPKALEAGTPEYDQLCLRIREILEKHGGLLVDYDRIPGEVVQNMFSAMPDVFDLPVETKRKNAGATLYYSYIEPCPLTPHYEAMAVTNSVLAEESQAFTQLMWPHGNDNFCQTLHSTSTRMMELFHLIIKMVFDSYGAGRHYESEVGGVEALLRMTRYTPPSSDEAAALGLVTHVDGTYLTILCQNDVEGLEFQSREGEWFSVNPGKGSFVIFVGQALKAWSNRRMYAVPHKVMLSKDKDRLSCGLFIMPKGDQIMKAPDELIDNEHPPSFKPFIYKEFLKFMYLNYGSDDALDKFAGI